MAEKIENDNLLFRLYNDYLKNNKNNNNNIINEFMDQIDIDNNDDFCTKIIEQLDKIRRNSTPKFSICIKKFNESYSIYKNNISKYIEKINNKFSKLNIVKTNGILLNYATKNVFDKLDYLYQIYKSIITNIEKNFELLNSFLKQEELIEQKNLNQYFLDKDYDQIFNCSLLNKLNYQSTDISKLSNNNYYKYFLHFLSQEQRDNKEDNRGNKGKGDISFRKCTIIKKNIQKAKKLISENYHHLRALEMNNINSTNLRDILNEIFNNQRNNNNNNLKKIVFNNCDLKKEIKNVEYIKFNKIEELRIKSGCLNIIFLPDLFLASTTNLKSLSLEKVNMSNIGLNILFRILLKYFQSLEYLSLAKNSITEINNIFNVEGNFLKSFPNLKYFNLHKNSIYIFGVDLEKFPQMKLLDLTSNSFNNDCILTNILKKKDNLVLFNDNIFISNCEENNNIYINYLQNRLKNLNFELKTLHLCFAYDEKAQTKLQKLKLSPSIKISLIKLDLSFCGLKTDTIIKFLKNNYGLFSLKVLDLKYNNIENDFFDKCNCDEINLEKLTSLNLSDNQIDCQEYEENEYLIKFIEKHEKLEIIKLNYCSFFNIWDMNISPNGNHSEKFRKLYEDFKIYLNKSNRNFVIQIDRNRKIYVEKRFDSLFEFK